MGDTISVVVIDDEAVVRLTLGRAIARERDMTLAAEASDGATALQVIVATGPDVVVMDVQMPGMSGINVVRKLRAQGDRTPVLFLTADERAEESARCLEDTRVLIKGCAGVAEALRAVRDVAGR